MENDCINLENLEKFGNLTVVREKLGKLRNVSYYAFGVSKNPLLLPVVENYLAFFSQVFLHLLP